VYNRLIHMCTIDSFICVHSTHLFVYNWLIYMCTIDSFICVQSTHLYVCDWLNLYVYNWITYICTIASEGTTLLWGWTHVYLLTHRLIKSTDSCFMSRWVKSHFYVYHHIWWQKHLYDGEFMYMADSWNWHIHVLWVDK